MSKSAHAGQARTPGDPVARQSPILIIAIHHERVRMLREAVAPLGLPVVFASGGTSALSVLAETRVSLVLLDIAEVSEGERLLTMLRESPSMVPIPVIVIGGVDGWLPAEFLRIGVVHQFPRLPEPEVLRAMVDLQLRRFSEVAAAVRRDPVTGLPDREEIGGWFRCFRAHAQRTAEPLTVVLITFAAPSPWPANGTSPRPDAGIQEAARIISGSLRESDVLARWAPDELAGLLLNTPQRGAERALHYVWRALDESQVSPARDDRVTVPAAMGAAEVSPGATLDDVIAAARERAHSWSFFPGAPEPAPPEDRQLVLLGEDDPIFSAVLRTCFERDGLEVLHFSTGAELMSTLPDLAPSLIVLEATLPEMDGLEVVQRVRTLPRLAQVPIVVLSAIPTQPEMRRAFQLGADDYVPKPLSPTALLARSRRLIPDRG